ncbi:MAG: hypothetical protein H5T73_06225 [Actinobacteria bacterium]|nr:hypothetical protein [Actinomycetota bacterium]
MPPSTPQQEPRSASRKRYPTRPLLLSGKGPFDNRLIFGPPILCDTSAERKAEVQRVMGEVVAAEERFIREAPGQLMSWFGLWSWWEQAQEVLRKTG